MLMIPLSDIKVATQNFSETYRIQDWDNCSLYKAEFDHFKKNPSYIEGKNQGEYPKGYNTVVIIRYPHDGEEEFTTNFEMLTSVKHHNIISLLGFSVDGSEMILVIENASKGFLNNYLSNVQQYRHIFTWEKRLKICIDVAHALCYLHYEMEDQKIIINRDICSGNIALDENLRAKIFDFGYAVFLPPYQEDEPLYLDWFGRPSYIDPEYKETRKLKRESDVYGFGVVMFEILCGRIAYDAIYLRESDIWLADDARESFQKGTLEDMIDPIIKEETGDRGPNKDSLRTFIEIAYECVARSQDQRPTMKVVVEELEKALSFQEGRIQPQDTDQVVNKLEKPWLTPKTLEMDLEHLTIRLSDITSATDDFSNTHKIKSWKDYTLYTAEFKYFQKHYHSSVEENNNGEHPKGHNTVVIKRYPYGHDIDFYKEIELLTRVKHSNIATLHGFCDESSEMILVINSVSKGYLSKYMIDANLKRDLTWEKRLKICIDVANALKYLHSEIEDGNMILNDLISMANIGLDENWGAKIIDIADFVSLPSNLEDKAHKSSDIDEISNIIKFGRTLFSILCGTLYYDANYRRKWDMLLGSVATPELFSETIHEIVDPMIMNETNESHFFLDKGPNMDSLNTFIEITRRCRADRDLCPTMEVVVKQLEEALLFQKNHKGNKRVSLEDITWATNNFHDSNCIGEGGFGKAYKGDLKVGDRFKTIVAKRLDKRSDQGKRQFFSELQILWEYKHENIIGLVGYCKENHEQIIVYEYASRGSLDRYLTNASLTWEKRLNICVDVASALDFLHGGVGKQAKVIHRDIKTANILLNNDWKAKLADFGLSLISSLTQEGDYIIDHWCGTHGYVDPVYKSSRVLTIESDIYSFGVVLFEILCGRSTFAILKREGNHLSEFIKKRFDEGKQDEVVFEKIREQIVPESLTTFQKIAYQCLQQEGEKRPATKEVLTELKKALEFQVILTEFKKAWEFQLNSEVENSEVESDHVEKSHASITETQEEDRLSGELNSLTMTSESKNPKLQNKEKILADQTNDSAEPSCCTCWPRKFRKDKIPRKAATPSRPNI